ncbi:MAG: hypothetical protein ABI551_20090 [Polyangiaceae bacterium]
MMLTNDIGLDLKNAQIVDAAGAATLTTMKPLGMHHLEMSRDLRRGGMHVRDTHSSS